MSEIRKKRALKNNKIDIIIPAYKAQKTIHRTIASIMEQTIKKDLEVTIVNDCCPNGDYSEVVEMYKPYLKIREIKMKKNGGPGVARQFGIDYTRNEFFTCIDADDTFAGAIALEILREGITASPVIQCCSATFLQLGENLQQIVPHMNDMVWMFGKIYRRSFIERYKIHFNETRANEDTGFNTWVRLLCNTEQEQIRFIQEVVYYWHNKKDSITRINDGQYALDQCFCGWTDNMIYAIENVRKVRPFSESVSQWVVSCMLQLYYYWIEAYSRKRVFADQDLEFVKKYYRRCYVKIKDQITDEVFSQMFSMCSQEKWGSGAMIGIVPHMGIKEFMDMLESTEYNEDDIYDIWAKIPAKLRDNNVKCGVSPANYWVRPEDGAPPKDNSISWDDEDDENDQTVRIYAYEYGEDADDESDEPSENLAKADVEEEEPEVATEEDDDED